MEKESRRKNYEVKQHHRKKNKALRKKDTENSNQLLEMLEFSSPSDLSDFMEQEYDTVISKFTECANSVNRQIIKKLFWLRDNWANEQKQRFLNFLKQYEVSNGEKIFENLMKRQEPIISTEGEYYKIYLSIQKGIIFIKVAISAYRVQRVKYTKAICAAPLVQELNFEINNKRVKKDVQDALKRFQEVRKTTEEIYKIYYYFS